MKRPISITICLLVACSVVLGQLAAAGADENQEKKTSNAKPDAGGIVIEPSAAKFRRGHDHDHVPRWDGFAGSD
jgi:hypothetical protein